jgi:hypothetical protein
MKSGLGFAIAVPLWLLVLIVAVGLWWHFKR